MEGRLEDRLEDQDGGPGWRTGWRTRMKDRLEDQDEGPGWRTCWRTRMKDRGQAWMMSSQQSHQSHVSGFQTRKQLPFICRSEQEGAVAVATVL